MKYPEFIKPNDQITYIAPSFGCTIEPYVTRLKMSKEVFTNLGYKVKYGPNVLCNKVIGRSNTPEKCGEEINYYFTDPKTKAIISVGGGELMNEVVPHIDFNKLKDNPKWFMGFSDNTHLTFLLPTICDIASIYGPCAPSFGITPWHQSISDAYHLLTGQSLLIKGYQKWEKESSKSEEDPLLPYNLTEDTIITSYPQNKAYFTGRLIGGCLDVLGGFLGTPFDHVKEFNERYREDGIIWFLEACDLSVLAIRRLLHQISISGWFQYVKGFIIGRPLNGMEDVMGLSRFQACIDILSKYQVPIIMDVDLGHLPPSMPIITGAFSEVTVDGNDITINMILK